MIKVIIIVLKSDSEVDQSKVNVIGWKGQHSFKTWCMGCLGVSLNLLFVNFKKEIALNLLFIVFLDYFDVLISKISLKIK